MNARAKRDPKAAQKILGDLPWGATNRLRKLLPEEKEQ